MHLIKVNAISSTNSFAREMFRENPKVPPTCIVAERQHEGRGQRGTTWDSEAGKNLTLSILYPGPGVSPDRQFLLSASVATGLIMGLKQQGLHDLKLKWPNDIMAGNLKLGGILIENVIVDGRMAASIIGIGLNVNQVDFPGLPSATSMALHSGKEWDLQDLLRELLPELENALDNTSASRENEILKAYKKHLFRYGTVSTFRLQDGHLISGRIIDVSPEGKLVVQGEYEKFFYDLKEISLLY